MDDVGKSLTGFEKDLLASGAYTLLEGNPAFREAVLQAERNIIDDWASTSPMEDQERERQWLKLQIFRDLLAEIEVLCGDYMADKASPPVEKQH